MFQVAQLELIPLTLFHAPSVQGWSNIGGFEWDVRCVPALCNVRVGCLSFLENIDMVVGHALLGNENLLAAIHNKVTPLHSISVIRQPQSMSLAAH